MSNSVLLGEALLRSYAHFVDNHQFAEAVKLFTTDAVIERPDVTVKGHQEIASLWADRPPEVVTGHIGSAPFFVRVDHKTAETVTMVTVYRSTRESDETPSVTGPRGIAEYEDQLVRTEAGWKIQHRKMRGVFVISG